MYSVLISYLLTLACITVPALVWRALLLDHAKLLALVRRVPVAGSALSCGFCTALWFSLVGVLVHNPIVPLVTNLSWLEVTGIGWCAVGAGVLVLRNLTTVLLEATGVLTDMHRKMHQEQG